MLNSETSISIVVPVFNVGQYLNDTLESLLQQKKPANEIILIDDGSTDGSANILQTYSLKKTIKIFKTSNNGQGPARNLGRMIAKSEYIYFFDSDDLLDPNFILRMHEIIREFNKPDLIMFAGESFYDDEIDHPFSPSYKRTISGVFKPDEGLITQMLNHREAFPNPYLYLSKNEIWAKNRLAFPPCLHEDESVFFPLLALSRKTVMLSEVYVHRRVRLGSVMTSRADTRNVSGILRAIHEMKEFMAQKPALVKPDLNAWCTRLAHLSIRYLALGRESRIRISWITIISCLVKARSIESLARIVFIFMPKSIQDKVKAAVNKK